MSTKDKKKKCGLKLVGATALSVAMLSPNVTAFAQPLNHSNKDKDKGETQLVKVSPNDLLVQVDAPQINKVGGVSSAPTTYIPENTVNTSGSIMTTGTSVDYSVPIKFRSAKGISYDFQNATLVCNPVVTLENGKKPNAQQQKVISAIEKNLQTNMTNSIQQWTSTGTYVLNGQITIGEATYGYKIAPNISLQYTNQGITKSIPIKVPDLLLTSKYSMYITPTVGSSQANVNGKNEDTITLAINKRTSEYNDVSAVDPNNPINSPISTLTIHVNVDKKFNITPINSEVKSIGNGNWVISGKLAEELSEGKVVNVFTYGPKDKNARLIYGNVTINTVNNDSPNLNLNNPNNGTYTSKGYPNINGLTSVVGETSYTKIKYLSSGVEGKYQVDRIEQSSKDSCNWSGMSTAFSSSIYPETYGNGTFYSGSVVLNGAIVCKTQADNIYPLSSSNNQSAKEATYVSLPQSVVNTLYNGTPEEKGNIFQEIISGKLGQSYTYNQVITGKNIPILNFIYVKGHYSQKGKDGKEIQQAVKIGAMYDKVPYKVNNQYDTQTPIVSQTLTYFKYDKGSDLAKVKAAFKPYKIDGDQVLNTDKMLGNDAFIITNPNEQVSESEMIGNTYQSTETRDGMLSEGISASNEYTLNYTQIHTGIDYQNITKNGNAPLSTNMGNLSAAENTSWLQRNHQIEVNVSTITPNKTAGLSKDATITIRVGTKFDITAPPTINGVPVKSYKVEGDNIVIVPGDGVLKNVIDSNIKVGVHFTDPTVKSITVTADTGVNTDANPTAPYNSFAGGIVNYVNGSEIKTGDSIGTPLTAWNSTVTLFGNHENYCEHYANKPNSNNDVTLTDIVNNLNKKATTYVIAGEIPEPGSETLPGQAGYSGNGGLTTTINSINPNGAPIWVLPKNALSKGENNEILHSTNSSNLVGMANYVNNPTNGWIKYKPGMSLTDIVGYMAMPTLKPGADYKLTYNVKMNNIESGAYQTVSSQYKYYDTNNNIGSTSPIATLAPNGENLENTWMANVSVQNYETNPDGTYKKGKDGKYIKTSVTPVPKADLDKILVGIANVNGSEAALSDLINHGNNVDADFDLTPSKLQNIVNLAYDSKALKEAGYTLDEIMVNGKTVNAAWFENVGIINNTGITHVRFIISKIPQRLKGSVTVKMVTTDGKIISKDVTTTGYIGTKDTSAVPVIPNGYHLVEVKDVAGSTVNQTNEKTMQSYLPKNYEKGDAKVTYIIAHNTGTVDGEIVTANGKVLGNIPVTTEDTGKSFTEVPKIPEGYQIVKTTVNGKEVIPDSKNESVSGTYTDTPQHIVWTVKRIEGQVTTEVVDSQGKVLVSPISTTGGTGDKDTSVVPTIPKGYKIVKITNGTRDKGVINPNGTEVNGLPSTYKKGEQIVVWHVIKINTTATTSVVDNTTGKVLVPSASVTIKTGSDLSHVTLPKVPDHYHIVGIDVNGVTNKDGKVTGVATPEGNTIVIKVAQDSKYPVDGEVVTTDGKVLNKIAATENYSGESFTKTPTIPKGYYLTKTTLNNKKVQVGKDDSVTGKYTDSAEHIVWTVAKEPGITVSIVNSNGTPMGTPTTVTGIPGTKTTGVTPPAIPKGYKIVKITTDGSSSTDGIPPKFPDKSIHITWVVQKIDTTVDTTVKSTDGTIVVPTSKSETIKTDSDLNKVKLPTIPEGWKVVGYETDGGAIAKDVEGQAKVTPNHIVVIVEKIGQSSVTTQVVDSMGNTVVSPVTTTGYIGSSDTSKVPNIPKGYKIVKITEGTKTVDGVPSTYTKTSQTIVWHVVKINTNVDTTVVTENGKVIVPVSGEITIKTGADLDKVILPKIPHGYKIIGYQVNGGKVESEVTGTAIPTGNHIKIIVKKVLSTVDTTVETSSGIIIVPTSKLTDIKIGSPLSGVTLPKVPYGYKIDGYETNGGKLSNGVSGVADANPNHIKIIVSKIPSSSVTITVKTLGGTILIPGKTTTGLVGASDTSATPNIPKGYHIVKIVDGNGEIVTGIPAKYTKNPQSVTWVVEKDNTNVDTTVETKTGQIVVPTSTPIIVKTGSSLSNIQLPKAPYGWKIVGYETNGQTTPENKVDGSAIVIDGAKVSNHIRVIVEKEPTSNITIIVKTPDGKILVPPTTTTGVVGGNKGIPNAPIIPHGYKIVKIVENTPEGGETNSEGIPKVFPKSNETITWIAQKINTTVDTTVKTLDGTIVVPTSGETTIKTGSDLSNVKLPNIPHGYKIVGYKINGGIIVSSVTGKAISTGNHIVTIVEKVPTKIKINIEGPNGKNILPPSSITGMPGTKITDGIPTIPAGWKISKITENGKEITGVPVTYPDGNVSIVYHLVPIETTTPKTKDNYGVVNKIKEDLGLNTGSTGVTDGTTNPKTGDQSELPEAVGVIGALAGLFILGRKKKKIQIEDSSK